MRVEPSLATEIVEYMMRYCCRSTGPPSQEEMTGFIIVASQAQAHTLAPEQKETLSVIPAHNHLEIVQEEGRRTQETNVSFGHVTSGVLPIDLPFEERGNPQVTEDDAGLLPDLE